ncbi:chaperonin 10-like protein [Exophiala viscosa]|uniref:D-xylulose reductase n=1 Tax=Exophiala viscosa TaxID=2486360 RepID=A0AAN6DTF5_9EURO|nr:chaperonin 10-like protein [Exophiala viscosa]
MSPAIKTQNPAFVLRAVHDTVIEERTIPKLRNDRDVRVEIKQTGICGSDVHYWDHGRIGDFILTTPIVLGHESSGVVVEAGAAVKNVKVGDRVAIEPGIPCRHCDYCRSGLYNLCPDTVFAATPPHDGTLSRYYVVAADFCYPIPEHMDMEEGALVEPVSSAVNMVRTGDVRGGQTVVVFGCGPMGVLCQAICRAWGTKRVIGIDIVQSRLDFAASFSGGRKEDVFMTPKRPEGVDGMEWSEHVAKVIREQFDLGEGPEVVLEVTGAEPCIQAGVHLCKKGGTFVQAGMGVENVYFPISVACVRGLRIQGAIRYVTGCHPSAVDLISTGKIDVKKLITHRYKFEQSEEAFRKVKAREEGTLKVMIEGVQDDTKI